MTLSFPRRSRSAAFGLSALLALGACAPLFEDTGSSLFPPAALAPGDLLRLEGVTVDLAPDLEVVWYDAAAEDGLSAEERARAVMLANVSEGANVVLRGDRPVRLEVLVTEFDALNAFQRVFTGGIHAVRADITMTDAVTGEHLASARDLNMSRIALGGVAALVASSFGRTQTSRIGERVLQITAGWLDSRDCAPMGLDCAPPPAPAVAPPPADAPLLDQLFGAPADAAPAIAAPVVAAPAPIIAEQAPEGDVVASTRSGDGVAPPAPLATPPAPAIAPPAPLAAPPAPAPEAEPEDDGPSFFGRLFGGGGDEEEAELPEPPAPPVAATEVAPAPEAAPEALPEAAPEAAPPAAPAAAAAAPSLFDQLFGAEEAAPAAPQSAPVPAAPDSVAIAPPPEAPLREVAPAPSATPPVPAAPGQIEPRNRVRLTPNPSGDPFNDFRGRAALPDGGAPVVDGGAIGAPPPREEKEDFISFGRVEQVLVYDNVLAVWDGRDSRAGAWIAAPFVEGATVARITNVATGQRIEVNAFARDPGAPGPSTLMSSVVAEALGVGQNDVIEVSISVTRE